MQQIGASELIINQRGAVYHLDLRPEEIADTIITVGDPFRVEKVSKYFDQIDHKSSHREFITHTGRIGNKKISVVSTGIGPDNIDIVMNELDALVNIDLAERIEKHEKKSLNIIRIGTSGSLQKHIGVDSYVASTHGIGLDNLLHFYSFQNNDEESEIGRAFLEQIHLNGHLSKPYVFSASGFQLAKLADNCHAGITVTCPGFYGPQGRVLRMRLSMPNLNEELTSFRFGNHKILNFEMETAAIYGLGKALGHQCISLSAIVANRIAMEFSKDADTTIDGLIRHTLERI
jgi:uridine phosphorylase